MRVIPLSGAYFYSLVLSATFLLLAIWGISAFPYLQIPILVGYLILAPTSFTSGKRLILDDDQSIVTLERRFFKWFRRRGISRDQIAEIEVSASPFEVPRISFKIVGGDRPIGILTPGTPAQVRAFADKLASELAVPLVSVEYAGTTLGRALLRPARKVAQAAVYVIIAFVVVERGFSWWLVVFWMGAGLLNRILFGPWNPRNRNLPLDY